MLQKKRRKNPLRRHFYGITITVVGKNSYSNAFDAGTIAITLPQRDI